MKRKISHNEHAEIIQKLNSISDTWSDLWFFLSLTDMCAKQVLHLKFTDVENGAVKSFCHKRNRMLNTQLARELENLINRRKTQYPADKYIFQSHSNRVKYLNKPVTLIAFNAALRKVGNTMKLKALSSKCATKPYG
ncbi:hypothetical protein MUU49_00365 [Scandinavium goeteborgense]|uniref:hypothetical protein n=1 Tax=Scandinavium goeteborgense TaxID=1851514 RepID=UPI0021650C92|nr:hypothetical protein [Scandinavium goeteborgense]MCS2151066.1 hypothetical protein [Scandinavium goeteborgense]